MAQIVIPDKAPSDLYTATEWNTVKAAINDNDTRLTTVESSATKTTKAVAVNTNAVVGDVLLVDASGGNLTMTLPTAAGSLNGVVTIIKVDNTANLVIADGNGSETITGQLTRNISNQYDSISMISDGTEWYLI